MKNQNIYDSREAAKMLRSRAIFVERMIRKGQLRGTRCRGGEYIVLHEDLINYVQNPNNNP